MHNSQTLSETNLMMLFIQGLIIGFAIAAPVGPIGVLCIQRSLHDGFKIGLFTGLGAAFADGIYGFIAGFGLTAFSSMLIKYEFWIRLIGGLFLLYLGAKLFFTLPQKKSAGKSDRSAWHALGTAFLLTLSNPATILSFVAVFAGLGLGSVHSYHSNAMFLVLGVILGSATWWLLLSGSVSFILHHRLSSKGLQNINRLSGLIIFAFGLFALSMKN